MKMEIETQVIEFDGIRRRVVPGSIYIIREVETEKEGENIRKEIAALINSQNKEFDEKIIYVGFIDDDELTEDEKQQRAYNEDGFDTIYLPTELFVKEGVWYKKCGYILGKMACRSPEKQHLLGKFCGYVENMHTREVVQEIIGEEIIEK